VIRFDSADGALSPAEFTADTVNLYVVPFSRPVMFVVVPDPDVERLSGSTTTLKLVGRPPVDAALQETVALRTPAVAITFVGTPGGVAGFDDDPLQPAMAAARNSAMQSRAMLDTVPPEWISFAGYRTRVAETDERSLCPVINVRRNTWVLKSPRMRAQTRTVDRTAVGAS
jgi:hypothetical protein